MTDSGLANTTSAILARIYPQAFERAVILVQTLTDEQYRWFPNATTNSLAWNLWHLARWADRAQHNLRLWSPALSQRFGSGGEFWEDEGLAAKWSFNSLDLGWNDTGMEMEPEVAHQLPLPDRETLLDYASRSFTAATREVGSLDEDNLRIEYLSAIDGTTANVESAVITWMTHNDRHLGMMECLRGLLGQPGSATR